MIQSIYRSLLGVWLAIAILYPLPLTRAAPPDWSENRSVPADGLPNPYGLSPSEYERSVHDGRLHALLYPVTVTGALVPEKALENLFERQSNPLRAFIYSLFKDISGFESLDDAFAWLGMHEYPSETDTGVYAVPYPGGVRPAFRMGITPMTRDGTDGITISCAECHAGNLFGKKVLGLTNRFPRANRAFLEAQRVLDRLSPSLYQAFTGASAGETRMYQELRSSLSRVGARRPQVLGLDTSLAQTALSLARRSQDPYATPDPKLEKKPREEPLAHFASDSKPLVWWNVKYKNRYLADGSLVAGNPIHTNFLWNELGRGTDLRQLEDWLADNTQVIQDLTTAVFSSQAPRFTDFFPAETLPLDRAKRGEQSFNQLCSRCHGVYQKAWSQPHALILSPTAALETLQVIYPERTKVVDVGTDPGRRKAMTSLERGLNPLAISQREGMLIRTQEGYVPPPLVGIWARWPYFHNNSAPSLCAVLTRGEDRPMTYLAGEALDPARDFDRECNGYPLGDQAPKHWQDNKDAHYDARREGLSNRGHDERIFIKDGKELLTREQKLDLILFLQTL